MREWEIGAVENIHGALPHIPFAPILALVGVGVNRIGKVLGLMLAMFPRNVKVGLFHLMHSSYARVRLEDDLAEPRDRIFQRMIEIIQPTLNLGALSHARHAPKSRSKNLRFIDKGLAVSNA